MFMEVHANFQNIDKGKEEGKCSPTDKDWENSSRTQRRMEADITSPKRGGKVPSWVVLSLPRPLWAGAALSFPLLKWCFPHSSSFGVVLPFCGVVLFRWIGKNSTTQKAKGGIQVLCHLGPCHLQCRLFFQVTLTKLVFM